MIRWLFMGQRRNRTNWWPQLVEIRTLPETPHPRGME